MEIKLKQFVVVPNQNNKKCLTEVNMGTPTAIATGVMTEDQFWMLGTMRLFK